MYDFTSAYLKPPLQIRVPHLHKAMSPNVTGDTVEVVICMILVLLERADALDHYLNIR